MISLQASPCIRFNKEGILLAVSTNENGIKVLANTDGIRLLRTVESRSFDSPRITPGTIVKVHSNFILCLHSNHALCGSFFLL